MSPSAKVEVTKCHACHAERRWMSPSATPATRKEVGCRQVPRLPRKVSAISATPATQKWMSPSATPATRNEDGCLSATTATQSWAAVTGDQARPSAPKRATRASPVP